MAVETTSALPLSTAAATASRWRVIALYAGVGIASYILFFFLTLPREQIGEFIAGQVTAAAPGVTITLDGPAYSFPAGLAADSLEIGDPAGASPPIRMNDVEISTSVFGLMTGTRSADVSGRLGSGTIDVAASQSDGGGAAQVELDNAALAHIGGLGQFVGPDATGSGAVDVNFGQPWQTTLQGTADLTLKNIVIASSAVPSLPLKELKFELASLDVDIQDGVLSCTPCTFTGPLGRATVEGTLKLASAFASSQLDVHLVLEQPPGDANPLFDAFMQKDPQGRHTVRLEGPVRAPRIAR